MTKFPQLQEHSDHWPLAYGGGHCGMAPPQTLKIKKFINSMRIFRCKCVFLGAICVFFGVILQNFPGGMPPDPLEWSS